MTKRRALAALIIVILAAAVLLVPVAIDRAANPVLSRGPHVVAPAAQALHAQLFVADLHADSLLWNRDPLARHDRGHVDVPRLVEGGVALQAFTIVTKTPPVYRLDGNTDDSDAITALAVAARWPVATWSSLAERVLYQAGKLVDAERRAAGRFVILRTAADLAAFQERRRGDPSLTAGVIGIEGMHALEDDLANLDRFFDAGVRMIAPAHFFDNGIGGSAHGDRKPGLTPLGVELVRRAEAKGMLLDLAHASPAVIDDVLAIATKAVVVSHTGVLGTCRNLRNISDATIRKIAAGGGLIGIGFWELATCDGGAGAAGIANALKYVRDLVGAEHAALGSDFDGTITAPFDATGMPLVTEALLAAGLTEGELGLVMGGNVARVLGATLPR